MDRHRVRREGDGQEAAEPLTPNTISGKRRETTPRRLLPHVLDSAVNL